ncbi:U-box domain-containing protein 33-like [Salvia hispanica]|uniref:U-box domain-containing protein 33-like n=1 Tax=Salvia hispanica TaxID=49212 RepID=UPI00200993C7|nr:U-box domain-containing protein 33-like [Salvia hispanica]XP_047974516.1 U-box domain-containing protein 33-like [Salvia hispanica]
MAFSSISAREEWRSEIEEEVGEERKWSLESERENAVYVAVWKDIDETLSMDALLWTLNNAVIDPSSALVFLVHVFPQTTFIPSPLGKLHIDQVNPEQKEMFLAQESGKRRDLLQKFVNLCSVYQVKVETILVESDMEGKAILDLIPILNITKLILGASKATIRRMKSRKGNGAADQIVHKAPGFCEVKIICEGKEVSDLSMTESPSPSPSPSPRPTHSTPSFAQNKQQTANDSAACGCFKI